MTASALPVRPLGSRAVLPPKELAALFGERARLRPSARVEVVRYGRVRRAKLYYLRGLRGKAARITERRRG